MDKNTIAQRAREQKQFFQGGTTKELAFRKRMLQRLLQGITDREAAILAALKEDLNKAPFEAYAAEVSLVREEIHFFLKNLKRFARPRRVKTPLVHFPAKSTIYSEPYGRVLIMSPWNYPFQLTLVPLIGALAAGNTAVVKPSNYAPATARVMAELLEELFPPEYVSVVLGGREANQALLQQKFDYIFFTGSVNVGKLVMESASRHLTPVSLELGGKSPCFVDESADIDLAARRIVWGKFLNAGQTCVAPDYLLVHSSVRKPLLEAMKKYILQFYGPQPETNPDFPKIITEKHFQRLKGLLESSQVAFGGTTNPETRQMAPTLVYPAAAEDEVMQEEIFGPLLPILEYESLDEAISFVQERPRPLALYLFTKKKAAEKRILSTLSFGGGCINETVMHLVSPHMPFGGVGDSGMGGYHGRVSFDTFSHKKSILKKSRFLDVPLRYPPYKRGLGIIRKFMG